LFVHLYAINAGRVTSLALKSLHAALVSQWVEILYIPVSIVNKMALWLTRQQNAEGAFVETSVHYYDRSFWVNGDRIFLFLIAACSQLQRKRKER